MAVDDVALALIELEDSDVRARVAGGDAAALEHLELTEEERGLVLQAAADEPEVAGFDFASSAYAPALTYLTVNRGGMSPGVRTQFINVFQGNHGNAWQIPIMG